MYIRRLPSKRYQCVIRLKGHKLSKTFTQRSDAKTWGGEQEYLIETARISVKPKYLTLKDLINQYRKHSIARLKDSYGVENQLKRLCLKYKWLINKPYEHLKPIDFEKFKNLRLTDIGNKYSAKNNYRATNKDLRILSIIINKSNDLYDYKLINHINKIKLLPEPRTVYRPIKGFEHRLLLKNANNIQKAIILLLRHTGARPKEIFNLNWDSLVISRNELTIPWDINKSMTTRVIPIRPYVVNWLVNKFGISRTGKLINMSYTAFRFWFYRKTKSLSFNEFTMYHYRRNFVQYHADRKMPLPKLASMVGHKSFSMIARYYGYIGLRN